MRTSNLILQVTTWTGLNSFLKVSNSSAIKLPAILKTRSARRLAHCLLPVFLCAHIEERRLGTRQDWERIMCAKSMVYENEKWKTIFDGGSLGSRIDEEHCRIQWIIDSLNANGALGFSQEQLCLSVGFYRTYMTWLVCGIEVSRRVRVKSLCPLKGSSIGLAFSFETWRRRLKITFSKQTNLDLRSGKATCWI